MWSPSHRSRMELRYGSLRETRGLGALTNDWMEGDTRSSRSQDKCHEHRPQRLSALTLAAAALAATVGSSNALTFRQPPGGFHCFACGTQSKPLPFHIPPGGYHCLACTTNPDAANQAGARLGRRQRLGPRPPADHRGRPASCGRCGRGAPGSRAGGGSGRTVQLPHQTEPAGWRRAVRGHLHQAERNQLAGDGWFPLTRSQSRSTSERGRPVRRPRFLCDAFSRMALARKPLPVSA